MRLMPVLDSPLLAARIASWHNRHPLARRISPGSVTGIGVVAVPFAGNAHGARREPTLAQDPAAPPAASTLRERAQTSDADETRRKPARGTPVDARDRAFDEDFLPGVSPRRAANFAARVGVDVDPSSGALPRRDLVVVPGRAARGVEWRFVGSAAIESHGRRVRILFCDGAAAPFRVVGPRIWAPGRIAIMALLPALALTSLGVGRQLLNRADASAVTVASAPPIHPSMQAASSAAPAELGEQAAPRVLSATTEPAAAHDLPDEPAAEAPIIQAAASATTASVPEPTPHMGEPGAGQRLKINLRPQLDPDQARRARLESAAARAGRVQEPAREHEAPDSSKTQPNDKHIYAVVARATRTRAASQVMLGLMQATVDGEGAPGARADVLPSEQGYRASWWPFLRRIDAEQARDRLAKLGVPVDVVEF